MECSTFCCPFPFVVYLSMMLKYHVLGGSQEYNPLDCTTTNNLAVLLRLGVQELSDSGTSALIARLVSRTDELPEAGTIAQETRFSATVAAIPAILTTTM